jgi:hypothetical protein
VKVLFLLAVAASCGKPNEAALLEQEAVSLAKYYQPKLDSLDQRVQAIFKRGTTIPANLPGIDEVGKRLSEARDGIIQLRGIIGPGPDGKSAVEKQAQTAAKDHKIEDLEKLVHDTEVALDHGVTVVNDDLDAVEGWIAQYDRTAAVTPAEQKPTPQAPTPAPTPEPPKPETPPKQ